MAHCHARGAVQGSDTGMEGGASEVKGPEVELIWRDTSSSTHPQIASKSLPWRRPATDHDLAEYIEDYLELLREGYRPEGYTEPPIPHCARVLHLGKVLAEWHLSGNYIHDYPA